MDWEAFAAIGEMIGGVAVLITIIYLAVQIRQNSAVITTNTRVARLAARHASQEALSRFRHLVADAQVADLYVRGCADYRGLSLVDRVRFAAVLQELLLAYDLIYQQFHEGAYEADMWERLMPTILSSFRQPGVRDWWSRNHSIFRPAFVDAVEHGLMNEASSVGVPDAPVS